MSRHRQTICVDFDGVLNTYNGWKGNNELYEPRIGAREFLGELSKRYYVVILTTRNVEEVRGWLVKYGLDFLVDDVTDIKVGAVAYIDDRALKFEGNYADVLRKLSTFKTHWEE